MDVYEDNKLALDKGDAREKKAEKAVAAKELKWINAANPWTSRQVQGCVQEAWEQSPAQEQRNCYPSQVE